MLFIRQYFYSLYTAELVKIFRDATHQNFQ